MLSNNETNLVFWIFSRCALDASCRTVELDSSKLIPKLKWFAW